MVTIRLARHGTRNAPFFHVTVAEHSAKRDGRFIERIGFFDPVASREQERLRLDLERVEYWLAHGARPSERVRALIQQARKAKPAAA